MPFTVVIAPEDATLTAPPPVANEVAPDDVNVVNAPVEADVAPIVVASIAPPSTFIEVKAESPLIKLFIEVVFEAIAVSASDSF